MKTAPSETHICHRASLRALRVLAVSTLMLGACANDPAPPADPATTGDEEPADVSSAATPPPSPSSAGTTFENPLKTCGAGESYAAVSQWRCKDGSVPLGGNPSAGMAARLGSSGSHDPSSTDFMMSHIVDIYEVPCPEGPVEVFVCLYHCPAGRSPHD